MFCPICGLPSETTGLWCSKHTSVVCDSMGRIISYQDIKESPVYFDRPARIPHIKQLHEQEGRLEVER